jgi:iron complex outermembrane receptor protein
MLCGASPAAGGTDTDLLALIQEGQTVETASRYTQSLTDAPAHVTIVTRQEIEEHGYETIGEAISSAAGFYLRDDLNYAYLGVRGFAPFGDYGSHVLIMIDGHPMTEPVFSSSFFQRNQPVDMRYVQRIEIVRGPASALYGTNAVLAVINIMTIKPTESGVIEVSASGRTDQGGDAFASLSHVGTHGFQAKISGSATSTEGFDYYFKEFDTAATNFGKAHDLDGERTWSVHSQIRRYGWSVSGLVSNRTKTVPTASWSGIFNDDRLRTKDIVGFFDSKYDASLNSTTHLSARLTFDWYSYKGVWPSEDSGGAYVLEDPHKSRVLGGELVVSSQALSRNHVVAGFSFKRVLSATLEAFQTEPEYYEYVNLEKTDNIVSAFAQDEISLHPSGLTAILGIRYDHYRSFGAALNPRFGLILKSRIGATKLLYGRSFRAPTLYERYYDDAEGTCEAGEARANPDLKAENAYTYEIVHEADIGRLTHAAVSAFYYRLSDLIDEQEIEGGCITPVNSGVHRSKGVEAELRGGLPGGLRWALNYALTDARNEETGERLPVSPYSFGTARLAIPLFMSKASLGLSMKYLGRRLTKDWNELDPCLVTNATLYLKKIVSGVSISVSAKNLFDAEHLEPAGPEHKQETLPQDERVFMIRASWGL